MLSGENVIVCADGPVDLDEQVARACAGDEEVWRAWFDRHYPALYRFFRSRVANHQTAEDLASDVFLQAYRSIESFKDRGRPFRAWLFGIARNLLAAHYRRRPAVELVDEAFGEGRFVRDEFLAVEVADILGRLQPDHRAALELRYVLGLTGEEAAAAMGRSHTAFRSLLLRATRAFERESQREARGGRPVVAATRRHLPTAG